jgi:hypothetical protein
MRTRVAPVFCWIAILGLLLTCVTKLGDARQTIVGAPAAPQKTIEYVEWKRPDPPVWLEAASEDEALDAVRQCLGKPVKIRCEKKPLDQALKLLEAQVDTKILINKAELGLAGIDVQAPVTVEASGKLKDVLRLMLGSVEDAGLSYRILTQGLLVSSRDDCDAEPQLRTFDMAYFLPDGSHADQLAMLVMQHVDPDNWMPVGGTSAISHFGSQLYVSAPQSTMERVETLLAKVAKQDRENLRAPKFKEDKPETQAAKGTSPGTGEKALGEIRPSEKK